MQVPACRLGCANLLLSGARNVTASNVKLALDDKILICSISSLADVLLRRSCPVHLLCCGGLGVRVRVVMGIAMA